MAEFVDTMGKLVQPSYLPYAFYIEGGALAVENALKIAFDWKSKKNLQLKNYQEKKFSSTFKRLFSWKNWIYHVFNRLS